MSDIIDPKYVIGFNHGYLLAEHRSDLTNKIIEGNNQGHYFAGFENGVLLYREQNKRLSRSVELKKLKANNQDKKDLER